MKKRPVHLSVLRALSMSVSALLISVSAQAFVTDTSNQKTILIGRGGAENMSQMQVTQVRSVTPSRAHAQNQAQYQNPYQANQQSGTLTQEYSTTIVPSGSHSYAQYGNNYNSFDQLAVTTNSAAVVVFDPQTGQSLFEKNIDATRSIASITKVMTAMVVIDAGLDMRDEIVLIDSDLRGAKTASTNLKAGDRLNRSEFMLMMLMKSENPAAKTLARNYPGGYDAFIAAMNQKAQSLGMYSTRFSDASGLDPRNVSSAKDLVKMMQVVGSDPRYQTIRNFSTARNYDFYINNYSFGSRVYKAANTSSLVRDGYYPITASKTGFIREAGHCVVMETYVNGRPAIVVLLGANGSSNRWKDAESILTQLAYRR